MGWDGGGERKRNYKSVIEVISMCQSGNHTEPYMVNWVGKCVDTDTCLSRR